MLLRLPHETGHSAGKGAPALLLSGEFLSTLGSELVELGFLIVVGDAPLGFHPALLFEAVERGIELSGFHPENLAGAVPYGLADPIAVLRALSERLKDEQVERTLQQLNPVLVTSHVDTLHPSM